MITKYTFSTFGYKVVLQFDRSKLSAEDAHEIAHFWSNSKDVLSSCKNNCEYEAVARYAATNAVYFAVCEGFDCEQIAEKIHEQEGWMGIDIGLQILDVEFEERPDTEDWRLEEETTHDGL